MHENIMEEIISKYVEELPNNESHDQNNTDNEPSTEETMLLIAQSFTTLFETTKDFHKEMNYLRQQLNYYISEEIQRIQIKQLSNLEVNNNEH